MNMLFAAGTLLIVIKCSYLSVSNEVDIMDSRLVARLGESLNLINIEQEKQSQLLASECT